MNTHDHNDTQLRLQTISECLRANPVTTSPAHSNGKPDVAPATTRIDVRFAAASPWPLEIKLKRHKWKHRL